MPKIREISFPLLGTLLHLIQIKIKNSIYFVMGTKESKFSISQTIIRDESPISTNSNWETPKSSHPSFNTPPSIYDYGLGSWKSRIFTDRDEVEEDFIFLDVVELSISKVDEINWILDIVSLSFFSFLYFLKNKGKRLVYYIYVGSTYIQEANLFLRDI